MSFRFEEQAIRGVFLITPQVIEDRRGSFCEVFKAPDFAEHGIPTVYVQDNESSSSRGVLRGLHFQKAHTQGKLIRAISGRVYDVAVDVRPGSPAFGRYVGVTLDAGRKQMLFVPAGFAHGFLVLSDTATVVYKCTDVYDPASEGGIPWNDPTIDIRWPTVEGGYITSPRDEQHPAFAEQDFSWAGKYL